jgi:hypothetical protein
MRALTRDGGEARFVGGAVRNALLGEPVGDIDIATPLQPADVMRRLKEAGLNAIPTGIEHGTVTAISAGKPFESPRSGAMFRPMDAALPSPSRRNGQRTQHAATSPSMRSMPARTAAYSTTLAGSPI